MRVKHINMHDKKTVREYHTVSAYKHDGKHGLYCEAVKGYDCFLPMSNTEAASLLYSITTKGYISINVKAIYFNNNEVVNFNIPEEGTL